MKRTISRFAPLTVRAITLHRPLAATVVLLALLSASACGFKLRGQVEIPAELTPILVLPQQGSPVRSAVVRQLRESQIPLTAQARDAHLIVRISGESSSSRVIAVDRDGKALASELHYGLSFDAVAPDGKQLVSQQEIDVVRTYENTDIEVLGKQLESESIYGDMIGDAANRILTRLRVVLL